MTPLELKDFGGGETDNFFQGEPKRAERLHNLLIGIDHKLSSRQGSLVKNNTAKAERINYIQSFNSLTDLLYASEGHFYDIDGVEVLGPSGNIAFVGATAEAMYTSSELQQQMIVACDEKLQPQKFYRDENGDLQVRTVGLPKVTKPKISDADLLTECIAVANSYRTKLLNHINSAQNLNSERVPIGPATSSASIQPPSSLNAHWSVDKYAKSYFQAVAFGPGQWQPAIIPTPAPAATDYASLVTLIEALALAFEEHRLDSAGPFSIEEDSTVLAYGPNRYHALGYQSLYTDFTLNYGQIIAAFMDVKIFPVNQGIQQRVAKSYNPDANINASIPSDEVYRTQLETVARFLDDFAVKFALHEVAPMVHRYNSQNVVTNPLVAAAFDYDFIEPLLEDIPVVIPTPFNFIFSSNYVQRAFNNHALNDDNNSTLSAAPTMHTFSNDTIVSGLPSAGYFFATLPATPTVREQYSGFYWDVVLAKLNIFTARYSYFIHTLDLRLGTEFARVNQDASGGAPGAWTVHLLTNPGLANYLGGVPGTNIISNYGGQSAQPAGKKQSFNMITAAIGAGSYNVAKSATPLLYVNYSVGSFAMHPYPLMSGNVSFANYTAATQSLSSFGYAPDIYSLSGWVDTMKSFYDAFKDHITNAQTHYNVGVPVVEFNPTPSGSLFPAGGAQLYPMSSLIPSVNLSGGVPKFFLPDTSGAGPSIVSYSYAFTYSDNYMTENDVTYLVESAPVFTEAFNSEETMAAGFTMLMHGETAAYIVNEIVTPVAMILDAPQLTNSADSNYSANVALNYYRTTGNGTTYSKVNLLAATPLDMTVIGGPIIDLLGAYDLVADRYAINGNIALQNSLDTLYTNGGILPSNQPPKCKYTWIANDFVYYGGVYDGNTFLPNRLLQSVQLAGDWVPSQSFVDFSSPIVGGGSARNVNICLTETGVFRLEGDIGKDGSGSIVKQQISNQIGGISGSSVVVTEIGLFFAGTNGFYYTDGYQCIRISQELFRTYKRATETASQKRALKGTYDRTNRRIYWSVRSDSSKLDNDIFKVFDLNFGITASGVFSSLFGATGSWNPSAMGFLNNELYIGDTDGYLYYLDEDTKTDPLKDLLLAPTAWETTYLPWEYRSTMMDFGGTAMRKFFSRIHHVGKNRGDVAIQYYITADNLVTQNLAPMRFIDTASLGIVDQWRRVGGKKLRADLYQIGCKNGRFTVYNSDDFGGTPVFVSNALGLTTLNFVGASIPTDSVGMGLCFASNYYATEFVIRSVTQVGLDTTVVISDVLNAASALLVLGWEIRGFMKDQAVSLDALTIWFEEQGNLGSQYQGYDSEDGGGGNQ